MAGFRWIFFDLFDTLCFVDEDLYYGGKRESAEAAGLPFEGFMEAWKGTSPEASVGKLRDPFSRASAALKRLGIEDRIVAAEVARMDIETIQKCVEFYPGATDALAALRSTGFLLGLISNATATTAFVLGPLHMRDRLDKLVFSYEVGAVKPDRAIFDRALERSGARPEESLFVGDGANHELDAARELGFATLRIDHPIKGETFRNPGTLSTGDHPVVRSFEEMLSLPWLVPLGEPEEGEGGSAQGS
jgi:putative hydrolase of the HAD superfamily